MYTLLNTHPKTVKWPVHMYTLLNTHPKTVKWPVRMYTLLNTHPNPLIVHTDERIDFLLIFKCGKL